MSKDAERDAIAIAASAETAKEVLADLQKKKDQAVQLVKRTEDAYSAATTMGLGASFEARATSLAQSMWVWVVGLLIALIAGSIIGWLRISLVEDLIKANASATSIWLNTFMSFVSIAAPVWFAWIATKQIGQRFRLAEDYAFKASVAKAYEGYRREAASIDQSFAQRLFSSALDRLEEAPLRFVEHETHGSPWHEAFGFRGKKERANQRRWSRSESHHAHTAPNHAERCGDRRRKGRRVISTERWRQIIGKWEGFRGLLVRQDIKLRHCPPIGHGVRYCLHIIFLGTGTVPSQQ